MAKKYSEAITDLDSILKIDPADADALLARARAHEMQSHFNEAIADYGEAIRLNAEKAGVEAQYALAKNLLMNNQLDQAIKQFGKVIEMQPSHGLAWANRGVAWKQKGDLASAAEDFRKALMYLKEPSRLSMVGRLLENAEAKLNPVAGRTQTRGPHESASAESFPTESKYW
jgi:tetratricopeptide (TPR) repeat protein